MSNYIYLDYAAATPMDESVFLAIQPYFAEKFFNPSAVYLPATDVKKDIEAARATVAHWLGARPAEVIFTSGGTEANNLAVHGVMGRYPEGNIVVSAIEHESVLAPASAYQCRQAPVTPHGMADVPQLTRLIDDNTVLVSVMYANNEVGSIQPIRQIAQEVERVRQNRRKAGNDKPLYLHTDAAQAAPYLDLHAKRLGVDMLTVNGGKIYGPKGSGALFVRAGVELEPQAMGGGQERGARSGTENVPGIIGLASALDLVQSRRREEGARLAKLQSLFFEQVEKAVPQAVVNGSLKYRLPNNVHITLPGQDNERLLLGLEQQGILAAAGSACSASNEEPSHVLRAMGLPDTAARASLRFTMGNNTNEDQIRQAVQALKRLG